MPSEDRTEIELEIAHVLFIDTVGYSKLLVSEQHELQADLNRIVRATGLFRAAEAAGKLIRLPTGDGMALVFFDSPETPAQCALEICQALRDHRQLKLRMGIHSGPVSRVADVNDRCNVAGAGINNAQRVMSCGDAGHILLSRRAADDLAEYRNWQPHLHDLGEVEVKHGTKIGIVNLYTDQFGNPELPAKVKQTRQAAVEKASVTYLTRRRNRVFMAVGCLAAIAFILALYFFPHRTPRTPATSSFGMPPIPAKSIAVLPFENLSSEKQDAYFADGVQDEILTDLAKVADLKVISRTSVMQYRTGAKRNLREIAKALGVAHVVEGTVQHAGNRVRVSAQLIDARTDAHLWAQQYEREFADIFAIQTEVAEQIVSQLQAKLSPEEKAAIEERPTVNLEAYDFYIRAKTIVSTIVFSAKEKEKLLEATRLLDQAVARDPGFFLAYCQLARAHDQIYLFGVDHTPERLALAGAAVKAAVKLRPTAGRTHLALAQHYYCGFLDYERARQELAAASRSLPNEPLVYELAGYIDRRQGRWEESIRDLQRVLELDPRNAFILEQVASSYQKLRRFADMAAILDRALMIVPENIGTRVQRAAVDLQWRADPKPLHVAIQTILAGNPNAAGDLADEWLSLALCERDWDAAERAVATTSTGGCRTEGVVFPTAWCAGVVARARGDPVAAQAAFTAARTEIEKTVSQQPDYGAAYCILGLIDAGLGKKMEAIREGRHAVELLPVAKDSINGPLLIQYLALIYVWTGEKDLALEQLAVAARIPGDLSYGQLRLHPHWDPLRDDPRFEKIVASLAPGDSTP